MTTAECVPRGFTSLLLWSLMSHNYSQLFLYYVNHVLSTRAQKYQSCGNIWYCQPDCPKGYLFVFFLKYCSVILLLYLYIATSHKNVEKKGSALFSSLKSHTGNKTTKCWISSAAVDRWQYPVHPRHSKAERQEEVRQVGKSFIQPYRHILNLPQNRWVLLFHFLIFFSFPLQAEHCGGSCETGQAIW